MDNLLRIMHTLGKHLDDEISIRQLSKEAVVPYTTAYRLVNKNTPLFTIKQKGNMKLCRLNTDDSITKNYLILAERSEADLFRKKNPQFKVLQRELPGGDYALILFGSRAEGTQRKRSDVDLCMISKDGKMFAFSKFELLFKMDINPISFTEEEFRSMLEEKEHNVAKEILKKHIVLYGEGYFWDVIWKNGI